jgi:hypothetical protein
MSRAVEVLEELGAIVLDESVADLTAAMAGSRLLIVRYQ